MPENSVIIRHPRPEDLAGLQSLWAASFPEDCDGQFIPWYFQNRFQPENCWLLEQQGVLTAMCFAPEVHLQLPDGSLLPAPYIQGVATAAEKQRRGYCRRLLAAAEQDLAARGYPLCILKPFNPDFYQPLGYRFFSYIRRYNLRLDEHFLAPLATPEQPCRLEHFLCPENAAGPAAQIYQEWCRLGVARAFARRSPADFRLLLCDHRHDKGQLLLASSRKWEPLAYALYTATADGLFIRELAFKRPAAARWLLTALAADYREDTPAAVLIMPDNPACCTPLPQTLAGWQVLPFAMLKLLTKPAQECYNNIENMIANAYFYEYF